MTEYKIPFITGLVIWSEIKTKTDHVIKVF